MHRMQTMCMYNAPKPEQKTVQEVLNDLKKYAARMIHLPDMYTSHKQFVSALHDLLCNEVLKKGYNAEFRDRKSVV